MKYIQLTQGKQAIVDDEDYEWLNEYRWHLLKSTKPAQYKRKNYAIKNSAFGHATLMHRLIMGNPLGKQVDHINGDTLDNRRSNLRICTNAQNSMNQKISVRNKTGYKGVHFDNQIHKYRASITLSGKRYRSKGFIDPKDAHNFYVSMSKKLFGKFANTG